MADSILLILAFDCVLLSSVLFIRPLAVAFLFMVLKILDLADSVDFGVFSIIARAVVALSPVVLILLLICIFLSIPAVKIRALDVSFLVFPAFNILPLI